MSNPHISRSLVLLLPFLFSPLCSYASSVVWVVSQKGDYVVIAAESRRVGEEKGKKIEPLNNDDCKVIALGGDTLFYETGNASVPIVYRGKPWNSESVARLVYKAAKNRNAQALSIDWGNRALEWWFVQPEADLKWSADPEGGLVNGGFINFDQSGNPSVFGQTLYYLAATRQLSRKPTTQAPGQIGVSGVGRDLVHEFVEGKTLRAARAYGILRPSDVSTDLTKDTDFVRKAVQFVIDNETGIDKIAVGGPIDVAVIRRFAGVDWVSRKKECYTLDLQPTALTKSKGRRGRN